MKSEEPQSSAQLAVKIVINMRNREERIWKERNQRKRPGVCTHLQPADAAAMAVIYFITKLPQHSTSRRVNKAKPTTHWFTLVVFSAVASILLLFW